MRIKYMTVIFVLMALFVGAKLVYSFTIPPCLVPMLDCKEPCYKIADKTDFYACLDACDCEHWNPKCKAMGRPPDNCDEESVILTPPEDKVEDQSQTPAGQ